MFHPFRFPPTSNAWPRVDIQSKALDQVTFDKSFPPEAQTKADELLGDGKYTTGYKRVHWEGYSHIFAVRGDLSDPKVQAGKGAFKAT